MIFGIYQAEYQTPWSTMEERLRHFLGLRPSCVKPSQIKNMKTAFKRKSRKHAQAKGAIVMWSIFKGIKWLGIPETQAESSAMFRTQ